MYVLINSGINDYSLPATVNACMHSELATLPQAEAFLPTEASYFDTVRTGDSFDL